MCRRRGPDPLILAAVAPGAISAIMVLLGSPSEGVEVSFALDGCPERIQGLPGEVKTFEVFVALTTADNESSQGAQGWNLITYVENGIFLNAAIQGIRVSTIYDMDADGDPGTQGTIHLDPYVQDLGDPPVGGRIFPGRPCEYALCLVDFRGNLRDPEKMVLQPEGTQRIAKLTVQTTVPGGKECAALRIRFVGGIRYLCNGVFEMPLRNLVDPFGVLHDSQLKECTIQVCPSLFRRGDSNGDAAADISDAIHILSFLFLGGPAPTCEDAADINDDAKLDISDPIFLILDLFFPGNSSIGPPGPYSCGPDPAPTDGLACEYYPRCP